MTDAAHDALVGFATDSLEDCANCRGKTFPGHECDGLTPAPGPAEPTWPLDHDV